MALETRLIASLCDSQRKMQVCKTLFFCLSFLYFENFKIMKTKLLVITMSLFAVFSCEFRKSVNKDLITGLTTKGDGLSCENVYLYDGKEKISRKSFTYGEKIYMNFENIEGFKKQEDHAFPGAQLFVLNPSGDTVFKTNDLYADFVDGLNISPLLLQPSLTVASPMHSNNDYTLYANIWDKKGEGTFTAEMGFNVVPNKQIEIESSNVSYDEIYLFSKEREITITDNKAKFNENIYLIFEGLQGFKEEAGKAFIGVSMKIADAEGNALLNEEDLIGDAGMEISALKSQLAPNFIITGSEIKNPVTCDITIWDKKGESRIKAAIKLNIE
jgi:hypothetical protein